jgi:hypothetical protein
MRERQQKEFSDLPGKFFAFSDKQFNEGMQKVGLAPDDLKAIVSIGMGGFIRKDCLQGLKDHLDKSNKELQDAYASDKNGTGFLYDAFCYEMANHEYSITNDMNDTLQALGLTAEQVKSNANMRNALKKAAKPYYGYDVNVDWLL